MVAVMNAYGSCMAGSSLNNTVAPPPALREEDHPNRFEGVGGSMLFPTYWRYSGIFSDYSILEII